VFSVQYSVFMLTSISHTPAETEALGEACGRAAISGWVIALVGDLGAGKTQLVKGLARGLGITGRVHSPTFTLVNIYPGGRLPLFHLDLYRLETREQIVAAGLEEYLSPAGITVIEWAERWFGPPQSPESKVQSLKSKVEEGIAGQAAKVVVAPPVTRHSSPVTDLPQVRWIQIEALNEMERRITYDDFGA
jgi:tRNA threonylcarbamoyladenosine biosynthesis protein TsaE